MKDALQEVRDAVFWRVRAAMIAHPHLTKGLDDLAEQFTDEILGIVADALSEKQQENSDAL